MNYFYFGCAIIVIYLIFAPRFASWFYRPVLFPRISMLSHDNSPVICGIKGKVISFPQGDCNKLCAWYFHNSSASFTTLVSHGNLGNIETHNYLTEGLLKAGTSVFIYDYSGYGASSGLPNLGNITRDAEAAYDYLTQQEKVTPENIILYGESLGAAITSYLATIKKAKAVICQSGFASLREIATEKMPLLRLYPEWLFPDHSLHTAKNLKQVELPTLIMHGEKDIVVPYSHALKIYSESLEPKQLISFPDLGHKDVVAANPDYFALVVNRFVISLT